MASSARDIVLDVPDPVRLSRPDQILRFYMLLDDESGKVIQANRHWNAQRGCTEECGCKPRCQSYRLDMFVPALLLIKGNFLAAGDQERSWEPVVLHLTENTFRDVIMGLRLANDTGTIKGVFISLKRASNTPSSRVVVNTVKRIAVPPEVNIDVAAVVQARLGLAQNVEDTVIVPARSRADKPRVEKGVRLP